MYAEPRLVRLEDCWFYHVMDIPGVGTVEGPWDLRGRLADYTGHVEFAGKRVLDVGAASGFLTFEMEKRGAEIVSFDVDGASRYSILPFHDDPSFTDRAAWNADMERFVERRHNSYWLAHAAFGSKARMVYGNVHDVPAGIGEFDVVMVGQILVHLADPIGALGSLSRRCRGRLVITEGMLDEARPIAQLATTVPQRNMRAWWHYATGLYRAVLAMLGFEIESIGKGLYKVSAPGHPSQIELTTIVARRS